MKKNILQRAINLFVHRDEPKPPSTGETAWTNGTFFGSQTNFLRYNTDSLVGARGADVYRKMLQDDEVKASYRLRVGTIIARPWKFTRLDDSPDQIRMEEFFKHNFETFLQGTFDKLLRNILTSMAFGISVNEKIWEAGQWEGQTYWMLKTLKRKDPFSFEFETDALGNAQGLQQRQNSKLVKLDLEKFVIHVNNPQADDVWGESELRAAYRHYWAKDNILKFWNIYLERFASGFMHGKITGDISEDQRTKLQNSMANMTTATNFLTPDNVDLNMVYAPSTDAFEKAIANKNVDIARALLVPNLLGLTPEGKTGALAQSEVHERMYNELIISPREEVADLIQETIIRPMAIWNFNSDTPPRFGFDHETVEEKRKIVAIWNEAAKGGTVRNTYVDEKRTRELLGYPEREEDEEDREPTQSEPEEKPEEEKGEEEEKPVKDFESVMESLSHFDPPSNFISPGVATYRQRVDYADLETGMDRVEAVLLQDMYRLVQEMFQAVVAVGRGIVQDPAIKGGMSVDEKIILKEAITPQHRRDLRNAVKSGLMSAYTVGRISANQEIDKAALTSKDRGFADRFMFRPKLYRVAAKFKKGSKWEDYRPTVKQFVDGVDVESAEDVMASIAFTITGDVTDSILSSAQTIISNGIRDGLSYPEMVDAMEDVLSDVLGERDAAGRRINKAARIETIVRTNVATAMNQARMSSFTDPDMAGFIQALEYSSVLDSRTSPFCAAAAGMVYPLNDPIWGSITPPNHFNCRSTIIAVTAVDVWTRSSDLPASVRPAKGFGR